MSEKTFEGATVEAALEAAAAEIGAAVSDLDHEVVEKKEDFWGMGESTFIIKAWRRAQPAADVETIDETAPQTETAHEDERPASVVQSAGAAPDAAKGHERSESIAPDAPDAAPSEDSEAEQEASTAAVTATLQGEGPQEPTKRAAADAAGSDEAVDPGDVSSFLEQIFHDMEFECTVEVAAEEEGFLATIDGADKDALLEGNGRCLSALELLANNAFRHRLPRGNKVRVDAGDFRNKRDEELSDLAFQVAHSAKESGRTQETQPLNPYERRLVHLALAEDPAVTTRSRGSGFLKNVQVIPSAGGGGRTRGRRS